MGEYVTVARVIKAQGRIGEVAAEVLTDFPERFAERRRLFALFQSGSRRELHLENFWPHKERLILKFAGVDSISDAGELVGAELQIPLEERAELEPGSAYIGDLVGCRVVVAGAGEIGAVADVLAGTGEAPLLEIHQDKKEYLVPFAQEYIRRIHTAGKRIEMELPEGMLELDAPLSQEEKDAQRDKSS